MSVLDYPLGAPFHYELEMKIGDEIDDIVSVLNNGEPDMITMDGKVLFNDGVYAIVLIESRFEEFSDWLLTFGQACELSPGFRDAFCGSSGLQRLEYVCIDVETGEFVFTQNEED